MSFIISQGLNSNLVMTQGWGRQAYSQSVSDTLTLVDLIGQNTVWNRSVSDTLTIADTIANSSIFNRSGSDVLTLADLITTQATYGQSVADILTLIDTIAANKEYSREIDDVLTIVDIANRTFEISLLDTLTLADTLSYAPEWHRSISDVLTLNSDIAYPNSVFDRVVADVLTLVSSPSRSGSTFNRTLSNALIITDLAAHNFHQMSVGDTLSMWDGGTTDPVLDDYFTHNVLIDDNIQVHGSIYANVADTLFFIEKLSMGGGGTYNISMSDTLTIVDAVCNKNYAISHPLTITQTFDHSDWEVVNDILVLADSVDHTAGPGVSDQIVIQDQIGLNRQSQLVIADSLLITSSPLFYLISDGVITAYTPFVGGDPNPPSQTIIIDGPYTPTIATNDPPGQINNPGGSKIETHPPIIPSDPVINPVTTSPIYPIQLPNNLTNCATEQRTITLLYPPVSPAMTLTIHAPEVGNVEILNIQRVYRQSRGTGRLLSFRDGIWPSFRRFRFKFEGLLEDNMNDFLTFISQTLGQNIGITDFRNQSWVGVVVTPTDEIVQERDCWFTVSFDFEGNLQ